MSRVGNNIISIPTGVQVKEGEMIEVSGPNGKLSSPIFPGISLNIEGENLQVKRSDDSKELRAKHGLVRSLLNNCIIGVTSGFTKNLVLQGVGYRAQKKGKQLVLSLGYSHDITVDEPEDVKLDVPEPTKITISGIDKQKVGQMAAKIRDFRKPEPYKGKGIRYEDEQIRRKAGKAGKK